MKTFDILTILSLVLLKDKDPPLKKIAEVSGLSLSQVFDSIERLKHHRLLKRQSKEIEFQNLEKFLIHAIPFIIPGELCGLGQGAPLAFSEVTVLKTTSLTHSTLLLWPAEQGIAQGMVIKPIVESINIFLKNFPQFFQPLSAIEILRFHDLTCRPQAVARISTWIQSVSELESESECDLPDNLVETLCKVVSETGFRQMDIDKVSQLLSTSSSHIENKFKTMSDIQKRIGESCAAKAFAHFGQAFSVPSHERLKAIQKSLLQFFDYIDVNEEYFRLGLWFYLERLFDKTSGAGVLKSDFFDMLEEFFDQIPSKKSKHARATLFANSWLTYAWFRWVEFPRMKDQDVAHKRLSELKFTLADQLE